MAEPEKQAGALRTAPRFYVTPAQRISPALLLLACVMALGCMGPVLYALRHSRAAERAGLGPGPGPGRSQGGTEEDDDDDPSRVDTIYLGGPAEAPTARRPAAAGAERRVHPFVVVKLPRSGEQVGQIPDTAAGRLLYGWMAAFNSKDLNAAARALPVPSGAAEEAMLELRRETGGFTLISAREVTPGVVVFRLQDQGAVPREALGTLQMRQGSTPAAIESFSLREVEAPPGK